MITDIGQLDFDQKYSYAEYLTWQFEERVELIIEILSFSESMNKKDTTIKLSLFESVGV